MKSTGLGPCIEAQIPEEAQLPHPQRTRETVAPNILNEHMFRKKYLVNVKSVYKVTAF